MSNSVYQPPSVKTQPQSTETIAPWARWLIIVWLAFTVLLFIKGLPRFVEDIDTVNMAKKAVYVSAIWLAYGIFSMNKLLSNATAVLFSLLALVMLFLLTSSSETSFESTAVLGVLTCCYLAGAYYLLRPGYQAMIANFKHLQQFIANLEDLDYPEAKTEVAKITSNSALMQTAQQLNQSLNDYNSVCDYQLCISNDDTTPMHFVVALLRVIFLKSNEHATELMLRIHNEGSAVVTTGPKSLLSQLASQIEYTAKFNYYPLRCTLSLREKTSRLNAKKRP